MHRTYPDSEEIGTMYLAQSVEGRYGLAFLPWMDASFKKIVSGMAGKESRNHKQIIKHMFNQTYHPLDTSLSRFYSGSTLLRKAPSYTSARFSCDMVVPQESLSSCRSPIRLKRSSLCSASQEHNKRSDDHLTKLVGFARLSITFSTSHARYYMILLNTRFEVLVVCFHLCELIGYHLNVTRLPRRLTEVSITEYVELVFCVRLPCRRRCISCGGGRTFFRLQIPKLGCLTQAIWYDSSTKTPC